jgi:hypothetical protein
VHIYDFFLTAIDNQKNVEFNSYTYIRNSLGPYTLAYTHTPVLTTPTSPMSRPSTTALPTSSTV